MEGFGLFEDCELFGNDKAGIEISDHSAPELLRCSISYNNMSGVNAHDEAGGALKDCELHNNGHHGLVVHQQGNPELIGCIIRENQQVGALMTKEGCGVFTRCEIHNNERAGVEVKSEANPLFDNCEIHSGLMAGVYVHDGGCGTFKSCKIHSNSIAGVEVKTRGSPRLELCDIYDTKSAYSETLLQTVGYGVLTWQSGAGEYCECTVHNNATNDWELRDGCQPVIRNSDTNNSPKAPPKAPPAAGTVRKQVISSHAAVKLVNEAASDGNSSSNFKSVDEPAWKNIHSLIRWQKIAVKVAITTVEDANCVDPTNGNRPLHIAAQNGFVGTIQFLVRMRAGVNYQNYSGQTALHMAVAYSFTEAADVLKVSAALCNLICSS